MNKKFLRLPKVIDRTGFSRSSIYALMPREISRKRIRLVGALWRGLNRTSMHGSTFACRQGRTHVLPRP